MNTKTSNDSGAENVLQGAMRGALQSGMNPSRLLAMAIATGGNTFCPSMVTLYNSNVVAKSDIMGGLSVAIQHALEHGTKPDELINLAVEGNALYSLRITPFNFFIAAFKKQTPALKRVTRVRGRHSLKETIEHGTKPDKPAANTAEGSASFTIHKTSGLFNFNIVAAANQNSPPKQVMWPPRKRTKTTLADTGREFGDLVSELSGMLYSVGQREYGANFV